MKLFYNLWPPFEYFVFILGPDMRLVSSLEPHVSMGISKKIYEKKISKTILKKKIARDPEIFQKVCVHGCVCVCVCVGGPASDQGGLKEIYSYMYTQ